jgi:hypothetical protein
MVFAHLSQLSSPQLFSAKLGLILSKKRANVQHFSHKILSRGIASLIATHILASSDYTAIFAISLADLYP